MAEPEYIEARRKEFREGVRSWHVSLVPGRDLDVFELQYVVPLRELKRVGFIRGDLIESFASRRGKRRVDRVDIVRA